MPSINLMANTSFDHDSNGDGLADGWAAFGSPTTTLDTTKSRSGAASQKVVIPPSSSFDIHYQDVPIIPGSPYTLSVYSWVAALNSSPAGQAVIKIEWHDPAGTVINYDFVAVTSVETGFTRHAVTSTPAAGSVTGHVILAVEQGGTVNWDQIQLEQAAHASPYQDGPSPIAAVPVVSAQRVTVSTTPIALNIVTPADVQIIVKNTDATNAADLGAATVTAGAGFPLAATTTQTIPVRAGEQLFAVRSAGADVVLAVLRG